MIARIAKMVGKNFSSGTARTQDLPNFVLHPGLELGVLFVTCWKLFASTLLLGSIVVLVRRLLPAIVLTSNNAGQ